MIKIIKKLFTKSGSKKCIVDDDLAYCIKCWVNGGMELDMPWPFNVSYHLTDLEQYGVKQYLKQNGENECYIWFYCTGIGVSKYVTFGKDLDNKFNVTDYDSW